MYLHSEESDAVWIAAKGVDVVMRPGEGGGLVRQPQVGGRVAQHAQPVLRRHHHHPSYPHQDGRVNLHQRIYAGQLVLNVAFFFVQQDINNLNLDLYLYIDNLVLAW
jgi:hypothetical protein